MSWDKPDRTKVVVVPALEVEQGILDDIATLTERAQTMYVELLRMLHDVKQVGVLVEVTLERHPIRTDEWEQMTALIPGYNELVEIVYSIAEAGRAYEKDGIDALDEMLAEACPDNGEAA